MNNVSLIWILHRTKIGGTTVFFFNYNAISINVYMQKWIHSYIFIYLRCSIILSRQKRNEPWSKDDVFFFGSLYSLIHVISYIKNKDLSLYYPLTIKSRQRSLVASGCSTWMIFIISVVRCKIVSSEEKKKYNNFERNRWHFAIFF